ncbi:ABC transporter substrate-binding protein [Leifsonia bigeumensis]|uniref:ABC transporter substrate-binding protein n=1 Tax=Leifsonella bigeumensis TaxID=433643 RepID=A0ABP7FMY0_9MICO
MKVYGKVTTIAASVVVVGAALSGCATDDGAVAPKPDDDAVIAEIADMVPKEFTDLVYVLDATYPPLSYQDASGKMTGVEFDLGMEAFSRAGITADVQPSGFDAIIPGIQAGKYDVSAFNDNAERQKIFDFVDLFQSGSSIIVSHDNPKSLTINTLCGHKVAVQLGSQQETTVAPSLNEACQAAGEDAFEVITYNSGNEAVLAVISKRADAVLTETISAGYAVTENPDDLAITDDEPLDPHPVALGMMKDTGLAEALQAALQSMMDDGTYARILADWGMGSLSIDSATINAGT